MHDQQAPVARPTTTTASEATGFTLVRVPPSDGHLASYRLVDPASFLALLAVHDSGQNGGLRTPANGTGS